MSPRARLRLWRGAIVFAYLARPWSCGIVATMEPRRDANPYHSMDPHGFATMAAWGSALLLAPAVLWLLLQRREAATPPRGTLRWIAAVAVLGAPMVMQWPFARVPLSWGWPAVASGAVWLAVVTAATLYRGTVGPSLHAAVDRHPIVAWLLVAAIGALKLGFLAFALAG